MAENPPAAVRFGAGLRRRPTSSANSSPPKSQWTAKKAAALADMGTTTNSSCPAVPSRGPSHSVQPEHTSPIAAVATAVTTTVRPSRGQSSAVCRCENNAARSTSWTAAESAVAIASPVAPSGQMKSKSSPRLSATTATPTRTGTPRSPRA